MTQWQLRYLYVVACGFIAATLISNVLSAKLFSLGPFIFGAGIIVFPISYIIGDVLTEVYGFARARLIIYAGFISTIFLSIFLMVAIALPPAPGWPLQEQFAAVHNLITRIVLASIVAYLAGEIVNSFIVSRMKVLTSGRHMWGRFVLSTFLGQGVDTALFVAFAFGGVFPSQVLVIGTISSWIFKTVYEAAALPISYYIVHKLKAAEGHDHFDR